MSKASFESKDLLKMRWVGNPVLSPNGEQLLYELTEIDEDENAYVSNIYLWDGKEHVKFTSDCGKSVVKNSNAKWSPDGKYIAFLSNRTGKNQVWLYQSKGDSLKITDMPKGVSSFSFSPDSKSIYFLAKERDIKKEYPEKSNMTHITKLRYKFNGTGYLDHIPTQIYRYDIENEIQTKITEYKHGAGHPVVSKDGRYIAFSANHSDDEQDLTKNIFILDLEKKETKQITPPGGSYYDPVFLDDNTVLCLGFDQFPYPGGYPDIFHISPTTNEKVCLTNNYPEFIGKRVGNDVSADSGNTSLLVEGNFVYFVITKGGNCYLERLNLETHETNRVFGSGQLVVSSFDLISGCLAANLADPLTPGDLWIGKNFSLDKITDYNDDLFKDKYIAYPEAIHFTNEEGVELEGWLLKPINYEEGNKHKVIMEIHGGPHTTYGNIFFHEFQILAGNNYAVFYANPRGSMGYGEDFSRAVVGDWCGCDARDLEFMANEISKLDWIDENHIGVTGGSQGGYFTNWLISHTNLFSSAVTQRSMSNLYTKYGIADNGWNGDRFGMGGADLWADEDFVLERSPIRYAPKVNTPLLIIHSDNDLRCPLEQAEQWYVALKRLGNITEMMIFHGENHNLSRTGKPANRLVRLDAILNWFNKYC
jgi:dipeptidyl aminopeptidase/acylaminoacyl peptidase